MMGLDLEKWAAAELKRLVEDDDRIQKAINKDILAIVKQFGKQGHSGLTASYALGILNRLLRWTPLTPLTGEDSEWNDVGDGFEQNNRCSRVFRRGKDNATAYDMDGKIFSDDGGETWYTNSESHVPITFPYEVPLHPEKVLVEKKEES